MLKYIGRYFFLSISFLDFEMIGIWMLKSSELFRELSSYDWKKYWGYRCLDCFGCIIIVLSVYSILICESSRLLVYRLLYSSLHSSAK